MLEDPGCAQGREMRGSGPRIPKGAPWVGLPFSDEACAGGGSCAERCLGPSWAVSRFRSK